MAPASSSLSGPLPYTGRHLTANINVLSVSLNKHFPSFFPSFHPKQPLRPAAHYLLGDSSSTLVCRHLDGGQVVIASYSTPSLGRDFSSYSDLPTPRRVSGRCFPYNEVSNNAIIDRPDSFSAGRRSATLVKTFPWRR